jgi:fumarate hydratase class II
LALIKWAAARTNRGLGLLPEAIAGAIETSALQVANGVHEDQFPVDVFQTGSGTSSNMNANEVIARLATQALGSPVHANDHVNMSQSSNDAVPSAIHVAASIELTEKLLPALAHLTAAIEAKARELAGIVKTGRTHLMDAMPVRLDQELGGWAAQLRANQRRLEGVLPRLTGLAQGGTAVGTGINAHPKFGAQFAAALAKQTGIDFHPAEDYFEALSCQDTAVELSGQLKTTAVSIMKIANDLRWMNSGPLAGLAEIALPGLQPGSSIMPVAAQVIGNDATITIAGQSGNFQLNVMLPVVALNLLQSIELLTNAAYALADSAIKGFKVNQDRLNEALERNPILVTALNPVIGYEKGAAVAKQAYKEGRAIREVAAEQTDLSAEQLRSLLDPLELTKGGIKG